MNGRFVRGGNPYFFSLDSLRCIHQVYEFTTLGYIVAFHRYGDVYTPQKINLTIRSYCSRDADLAASRGCLPKVLLLN